jgi:hypothetical protein
MGLPDSATSQGNEVISLWQIFLSLAIAVAAMIWCLVAYTVITSLRRRRQHASEPTATDPDAGAGNGGDRGRAHIPEQVQYRTRTSGDPLPIDVLVARQDAVTARWLSYETDPAKALSFPQMLDSQHPATLAFLRAQRQAQELRPDASRERVTPSTYLAYRDAVVAAEDAFETAESDALGVARENVSGLSWGSVPISLPSWVPRAADLLRTVTDTLSTMPAPPTTAKSDSPTTPRPPWPAPAWRSAPPPQQ